MATRRKTKKRGSFKGKAKKRSPKNRVSTKRARSSRTIKLVLEAAPAAVNPINLIKRQRLAQRRSRPRF